MRCPKCGYISFDHVDTCLRCNKDISKSASEVEGTTYNVAPPSFLKFTKSSERTQPEEDETLFDNLQNDNEVIDPDLDVLVEEDEGDEDASISFGDDFEGFDNLSMEEDIEIAEEDEGEGIGLDLGQFEDAFEGEEPPEEDKEFEMEMPDELADISDLSAPAAESEETRAASPAPAAPADDDLDDDFSLDLDLQELEEDDFSLDAEEAAKDDSDDPLGELSLDDLGLSETETEEEKVKPKPKKASHGKTDMDADLDFDLDLGGISLDEDED